MEKSKPEERNLVSLGRFLKVNRIDDYSAFVLHAEDDDGMGQISDRQDIHATFTPKTAFGAHMCTYGIRGHNLAVWSNKTSSGFVERAKLNLDIVTVRFILEGQVSRLGSLGSLDCAQGHGLLLPHAEIADLTADENTRTFGFALDRNKLHALSELFERPRHFSIDQCSVMAPINSPGVKSCMELSRNIMEFARSGSSQYDWLYNMMEEALFIRILTHWPRVSEEKKEYDISHGKSLKRALDFIDENISTQIAIGDIAKATGIGIRAVPFHAGS